MAKKVFYKLAIALLVTSVLFSSLPFTSSANIGATEEQEFVQRHFLLKIGTHFELNNSRYLNVSIISTATVKMILCAPPQTIEYLLESVDGSDSTTLTLSHLQSFTTYYMYEDGYLKETVFTTGIDGSYTYTQDLSKPHHILIQLSSGTIYIYEDTVLTQDVYDNVMICANNIVLDLNGYSIIGGGIYCGCTGVTMKNGNIRGSPGVAGIDLGGSSNIVENLTITECFDGVHMWGRWSSKNRVDRNTIAHCDSMGIVLAFGGCTENVIHGNTFFDNVDVGVFIIWDGGNNKMCHNNFANPFAESWSAKPQFWDDGYPSGGNYWDGRYHGVDLKNGPYQNETGSDGIGDTPCSVWTSGQDTYPLMSPYTPAYTVESVEVTKGGQTYPLQVVSTSTITDVAVGKNILHFDISGPAGTSAYVTVASPIGLNTTDIKVFLNGTKITYPVISKNSTHYFVHFAITFTSLYEITVLFDPVAAVVDLRPGSLNLLSEGEYVTAYVELPEGCSFEDIDMATISLNGSIGISLDAPTEIGDYDRDGTPDLMVKFDRASVAFYILENAGPLAFDESKFTTVSLTLTGEFFNGTPFQGTDLLKAILVMSKRYTQDM